MGTRYYLKPSGADMEVMAYVTELPPGGEIEREGHSVSVRMVKAGEWYQAVVEGDIHETFVTAYLKAEEKLMELRGLVFTEGARFQNIDADIYVLRRLTKEELKPPGCPVFLPGFIDFGDRWVKPCGVCKRDPEFGAVHAGCERCETVKKREDDKDGA